MTVQAPHSPVLQQSLVPLYSRVSRRNSNNDVDASAPALTALPLMVVVIVILMLPPCRWWLSRFVPGRGGSKLRRSSGGTPPCCAGCLSGFVSDGAGRPPL